MHFTQGLLVITQECGSGNTVGLVLSVCVSVPVCPVRAITFDSLDLETSFLVCRYI